MEPLPDELEGVGITEKLDNQVPLGLDFKDERGNTVKLEQYFNGKNPVILTLVYYRCPMLCGLILNGLTEATKEVGMTPGDEFQIVTVSIDPLETPQLATVKKQSFIKELGVPEAANGWHFLTGKEENIKKLADSVGYGYKWIESRKEFAHGSAIMILTPEGHVSRYLSGIQYDPKTVRLSLVEASEGKIGTAVDHFVLTCFQYDPSAGSYVPFAMGVMRIGGVLTMLLLGSLLTVFWIREMRKKKTSQTAQPIEGNT